MVELSVNVLKCLNELLSKAAGIIILIKYEFLYLQ